FRSDIPEVALVAILAAHKEGYLRSRTSLIQTAGRAARNLNGEVIMYADHVTDSMAQTLRETERRRALQAAYNEEHGITPETIRSSIRELLQTVYERDYYTVEVEAPARETFDSPADLERRIGELDAQLKDAAPRTDVYSYKDAKAQVVYVGKASSLRSRVRSYFHDSRPRDAKTDALVRQIVDLEYIVTDNELEALMLEANLVRKHRPRYNIILRDDKHYPFLKLTTNEDFPRLLVARRVQNDGAIYYGPFYPATAMRETLKLTRQLFPLRTCSITIDGTLE